jgi:hypothetical protein
MLPRLARLAVLAAILCAAPGCAWFRERVPDRLPLYSARAEAGALVAGAAAVDITPESAQYLGGFHIRRKSTGVHDPLYARALVLRRGELEMALIALDLVGLMRPEVQALQREIASLDPRHLIVCSTHVHHSPDTMGLWGFPPFYSGVDPDYMAHVRRGAALALERARAAARPAVAGAATIGFDPERFVKNSSRPGLFDPEIAVLHLRERDGGATIATLFELGCHPEAIKRQNTEVSADYPGRAVAELERELGGVGIYVSGALGALVSPAREKNRVNDPLGFGEAQRIGGLLADYAAEAVRSIERYEEAPRLALWHSPLYLRSENWRFDLLRWTGIVERPLYGAGYVETEVSLWHVGDLALAMVPGEISPDLGLRIKRACGERVMLVGLANDELGYLIPPWDYDLRYYDYERTLCPGPEAGWSIVMRLEDLALFARYAGD